VEQGGQGHDPAEGADREAEGVPSRRLVLEGHFMGAGRNEGREQGSFTRWTSAAFLSLVPRACR
jgi:hypothetical protein